MSKNVTIKYGLTKQVTRDADDNATLRDIISNPSVRAILGYPENVVAVIDGVTYQLSGIPENGDVIHLEQQAASKAA
jgi:hypothetical protein